MRIMVLRIACVAAAGLFSGFAAAQKADTQGCPCFRYNGADIHANYTEYSATNGCSAEVNFRSWTGQFGTTQLLQKGETKTWRCTGGTKICGELKWQKVDNCPGTAEEPRARRSKASAAKSGGSGGRKAASQSGTAEPAR